MYHTLSIKRNALWTKCWLHGCWVVWRLMRRINRKWRHRRGTMAWRARTHHQLVARCIMCSVQTPSAARGLLPIPHAPPSMCICVQKRRNEEVSYRLTRCNDALDYYFVGNLISVLPAAGFWGGGHLYICYAARVPLLHTVRLSVCTLIRECVYICIKFKAKTVF